MIPSPDPTHTRSPLTQPVSLFRGAYDTTVIETVPLQTVLARIRTGDYHRDIARMRPLKATDEPAYKRQKAQLIAFTPACALTTRDKDVPWTEKLQGCTGLVHFDIDHVRDVHTLKAHLRQQPSLVFAFVSPGGDGLKLGIAATGITDPETYRRAWQYVHTDLQGTLTALDPDAILTCDLLIKYVGALCFVSDDPMLYMNPHAEATLVPPPTTPPAPAPPEPQRRGVRVVVTDQRQRYAQHALDTAIHMLDASHDGSRHRVRCKVGYLIGGYISGGVLDEAEALATLEPAVRRNTQHFTAAWRTVLACLAAGKATAIRYDDLERARQDWLRSQGVGTLSENSPPPVGMIQKVRVASWHI